MRSEAAAQMSEFRVERRFFVSPWLQPIAPIDERAALVDQTRPFRTPLTGRRIFTAFAGFAIQGFAATQALHC